ncbi:MAG: hypothetical protein P4L98_15215, partial [Ancalomicrobiaceae bacterium]|nr:hypothetical protein [Ancalomicrobiaceae bacterium]
MNRPIEPITATRPDAPFVDELRQRLSAFDERMTDEPKFNPIAHLAYHLSRDLEAGRLRREHLAELAGALAKESLAARAKALSAHVGPVDVEENRARLRQAVERLVARAGSEEEMLTLLSRRALGIIFTAHPTFLLSSALRHALAEAALGKEVGDWPLPVGPDKRIALSDEHDAAMEALDHAKGALGEFAAIAADVLRAKGVKSWRSARITYC